MNKNILVSASRLGELIASDDCVTVDCRFDFSDTSKGRADWLAGHIPGAVYAHLDHDLAAPIQEHTGRHPLPDPADFARFLASAGWSDGKLLVAYDENSNAMASRLWWMMQYFGQPSALLDGGLAAWVRAGYELESGPVTTRALPVEELQPNASMVIDSPTLHARLDSLTVLDARASERFTGQAETLDSKAGHIPGALNRPFGSNLKLNGSFKEPATLLAEFEDALDRRDPGTLVHSCGSGVTACHNLFAMELAGMGMTRLYPGSWSEWIRDPERGIETGR
jgi:thiosulfate/3-mercaptopyruvate sulfurtransferase